MVSVLYFLKKLGYFFRKMTVGSISTALAVIVYGTFSEYYFERNIPQSGIHSLFSSLWWTMQTLTTVGYGDTPVYGYEGRINAIFIMVIGIGSLGLFLASMSATITNARLKRRIGMMRVRMKKHAIVCNYDPYAREIVNNIVNEGTPVVVVTEADLPAETEGFEYVKGSCLDDETLERAGIRNSSSAIILAGRSHGPGEEAKTDAMTILMSMKIKTMNPDTLVIAEILLPKSVEHAETAGVDEPIIRGSLSLSLISKSIFLPGLSKVLTNLIAGSDDVIVGEENGEKYADSKYGDMTADFLKRGRFVIGLRKGKKMLRNLHRDSEVDCDSIIFIERRF